MATEPGNGEVRTLADRALAELKEAIVSGAILPGAPVRLQRYVETLGMSAVPIREAMRFLEQRGLLDRTPHRGVYVSEMSAHDLEDTYRIRLEVESMAVRQAALRMTADDRANLRNLVDKYAEAAARGGLEARESHGDLHMQLYRVSRSKWLMVVVPMLWDNSERYRRLSLPYRGTPEGRVQEHRRIVEACIDGDPDLAERYLREHLSNSFEAAIVSLREQEESALLSDSEDGEKSDRVVDGAHGRSSAAD